MQFSLNFFRFLFPISIFSPRETTFHAVEIKVHDLTELTIRGSVGFGKNRLPQIAQPVSSANKHEPRVYLRDRKKRKQFSLATVERTTNFSNIASWERVWELPSGKK